MMIPSDIKSVPIKKACKFVSELESEWTKCNNEVKFIEAKRDALYDELKEAKSILAERLCNKGVVVTEDKVYWATKELGYNGPYLYVKELFIGQ